MIPAYKLCKDCQHFRPYPCRDIGGCARQWHDYITGKPLNYGGDGAIPAWHARRDFCQAACGWEKKEEGKS